MINCSWHLKRSFWRFWHNRFPGASCPDGWTQFDESCYYLSKAITKIIINVIIITFYTQKCYCYCYRYRNLSKAIIKTFAAAKDFCNNIGGYLVEVGEEGRVSY